MHTHLDPLRLTFRKIGLILTVVSAALTGLFGITMSSNWLLAVLLCVGLMAATVASAYVWPFVASSLQSKNRIAACVLAAFGVLVTTTDLTTNFGSIAWQRGTNIEEAKISTVRFDDSRDDVEDLKAKKAFFEKRLADLEATSGWSAGKPSSAYNEEIEAARLAVELEAKRGGCKSRCLARKQELAELEANRATALAHEKDAEMLAATIAGLQKTRERSAAVEKVESAAMLQNVSLASMFTLSRAPSEEAQHWTDKGVAWLVAAFFTFGAMGCNFIGWGTPSGGSPARRQDAAPARDLPALPQLQARVAAPPVQGEDRTTVVNITDRSALKAIAKAIEDAQRGLRPNFHGAG